MGRKKDICAARLGKCPHSFAKLSRNASQLTVSTAQLILLISFDKLSLGVTHCARPSGPGLSLCDNIQTVSENQHCRTDSRSIKVPDPSMVPSALNPKQPYDGK